MIAVFAVAELQRRAAGRPAVRRIPAQHAGARRDLAQTVLVLQFSRAVAGVQRELGGVVEEGVWPDGAGDEPGAHRRRLLAELWHRVHQQRGDASHRRRGHAGAAGFRIAAAGTTAGGGDKPHAGADDLRPQAPVQRRALAAEAGDVAFPGRRADRQRILRGSVVAAPTEVGVASRDDVDLAMPPHGGVQLAFVRRAPFPVQAVAAQAHVHDQGLGRLAAAGRRFGKEVDALADGHGGGRIGVSKHLPEADVARQRGHAGVARLDSAAADDGAGDVGAVADDVHPQIAVFVARRADAAGHEVGAADARSPACDVRMVNVQAGVEHAHRHGRASAAGEQARRRIEAAQRIRAHGRHRRVVGRPEDADRFNGKHEVRRDQRRERPVGNVGGIGARIWIEAANHGAEVGERLAPDAVWIVRHQGDEGRRLLQGTRGRELEELRGGLGSLRRRGDAGNAGQVGDPPQLRCVRRQTRPQQAATAPEHLAAQGRQRLRDPLDIRGRRRADPAEGPIATVRACSLRRQRAHATGGRNPFVAVGGFSVGHGRIIGGGHAAGLHFAVECRERVARRRLRSGRRGWRGWLEARRRFGWQERLLRRALRGDVRQRRIVGGAFLRRGFRLARRLRQRERLRRCRRFFARALPREPGRRGQGDGQGAEQRQLRRSGHALSPAPPNGPVQASFA